MKIVIMAVGKKLDIGLDSQVRQYVVRMRQWADLDEILIKPSRSESALSVIDESRMILSAIMPTDFVVLLDEQGVMFDSISFSETLDKWRSTSKRIVFVIGGAYGVNDDVRNRADFTWSLSKLVFPHELARLLLYEQLYRALSIKANKKYHHQ